MKFIYIYPKMNTKLYENILTKCVFYDDCRGFCMTCASQLQHCPMCRAEIVSLVEEESEAATSDDFLT